MPPRVPSKQYLLEQSTARTREILRKHPPLDVMVFTMNAFVAAADLLGSQILEVNERTITRLSLLERAAHIAKDAAPYVHPRLANLEHTGKDGKPMVMEHRFHWDVVKTDSTRELRSDPVIAGPSAEILEGSRLNRPFR